MHLDDLERVSLEDLEEHVYELFVTRETENGLGIIDRTSDHIEISVGDIDLNITQSKSLLSSGSESSTTGAVAWKVSPLFARWALTPRTFLHEILTTPDTTVVELGAGTAGILASVFGPRVGTYIATDQKHLLKLLRANILENTSTSKVEVYEFDWEETGTLEFEDQISHTGANGLVIACDTIYNEFLIPHFVKAASRLVEIMGHECLIVIAQQLRSSEILESSLRQMLQAGFSVWSVGDDYLSPDLQKGFAVHLAQMPADPSP